MTIVSHCVWCKQRFSSTVPELCDDLRKAIEEADQHNALIMAFATELALMQESWPYCSRRCENEDSDYPALHPEREGLEDTLRNIDSLPWDYIKAKSQGLELPVRPEAPKLVALETPVDKSMEAVEQPASKTPVQPPDLKLLPFIEEAQTKAEALVIRRRKAADASFRQTQGPRLPLWTFGVFTVGFFAGSLVMHLLGVTLGNALLTVSGSTLIIGGLLGVIAAMLAKRQS